MAAGTAEYKHIRVVDAPPPVDPEVEKAKAEASIARYMSAGSLALKVIKSQELTPQPADTPYGISRYYPHYIVSRRTKLITLGVDFATGNSNFGRLVVDELHDVGLNGSAPGSSCSRVDTVLGLSRIHAIQYSITNDKFGFQINEQPLTCQFGPEGGLLDTEGDPVVRARRLDGDVAKLTEFLVKLQTAPPH